MKIKVINVWRITGWKGMILCAPPLHFSHVKEDKAIMITILGFMVVIEK